MCGLLRKEKLARIQDFGCDVGGGSRGTNAERMLFRDR